MQSEVPEYKDLLVEVTQIERTLIAEGESHELVKRVVGSMFAEFIDVEERREAGPDREIEMESYRNIFEREVRDVRMSEQKIEEMRSRLDVLDDARRESLRRGRSGRVEDTTGRPKNPLRRK